MKTVFGLVLLVGLCVPTAFAADLYVGTQPGDYATIQDALDAAAAGDSVFVRPGTYHEDITIDKPDILLQALGVGILDGNMTVTAAAANTKIARFLMTDGKTLLVEDGIILAGAMANPDPVSVIRIGADYGSPMHPYDVTLGNVTADVDVSVTGIEIGLRWSDHVTVTHTGTIEVKSSDPGSSADGLDIAAQDNFQGTLGNVIATGGGFARGISLSTTSDGTLTHIGFIDVMGNDADSYAEGVHVTATSDMNATVGDIAAEAGDRATGIYWRTSGDGGSLTQSGVVHATGREATSQAYGVDVVAENGFSLTVGSTTVSGGNLARGVSYYVGQGGHLTVEGDVAATTGGNAHGLLLNAGRDFEADVKNVTVTGGGNVVQGIAATMGDRGTIRHTGSITVQGTDLVSNVRGVNVNATDDMNLSLGDIDVEGLTNAIGIYTNAGSGGTLTQTGAIQAKTTAVASSASGTAITAGDNFTMTIGDIVTTADATGSRATGVFAMAGDGLTSRGGDVTVTGHTSAAGVDLYVSTDADVAYGNINVTGTAAGSSAFGMRLFGGKDAQVTLGDLDVEGLAQAIGLSLNHRDAMLGHFLDNARVTQTGTVDVVARQSDSEAYGVWGAVGNDFTAVFGDVNTTAKKSATGLFLSMGDGATIDVGDVQAIAEDADSTAYGARLLGNDALHVIVGDVSSEAGDTVHGLSYKAGSIGTLAHAGTISATARDAGSYAYGAWITDEGDVRATLDNVVVSADQFAKGVTLYTQGTSSLTLSGDIDVTGRNGDSTVYGVDFSGGDALLLELQNVTVEAGKYAYGVNLGGTTGTLSVRGDVSATTRGGDIAMGLIVRSLAADVTNHGHLYVAADHAIGVGFGQYGAAESVNFHNIGTVEISGNAGAGVFVNVTESATVENYGTIDAAGKIAFNGSDSTGLINVSNSGTMSGDVYLGRGADTLSLSEASIIDGNVYLGAGDDVTTIHYGAVLTGLLDGGAGDDVLKLLGDGASELSNGFAWNRLVATKFEQTSIEGGAWQLGFGSNLGNVDVVDAFLRIDDTVSIADVHLHDAVLVGKGNVTGNVTNDGGVVSPGNSFGIMTITGDYTQGPEGVLLIEVDTRTAPDAGVNYDQLVIVGGAATFEDGTTVRIRPTFGATRPDRAEYMIVEGDVDFNPDAINLILDMAAPLFYGGHLERGSMKLVLGVLPYASVSRTLNQRAVAHALTRAKSNPDTDLNDVYNWLDNLASGEDDAARAAFDSLSGEVYAHVAGLNSRIADRFAGAVLRSVFESARREEHGLPREQPEPGRNLWAAAYTDTGRAGGDGGATATFNLSRIVAGVDLVQRPNMRIGLSAGGGTSSAGAVERSSALQGNGYLLGAYGQFDFDKVGLAAVLGFGQETYNARRAVQFGDDKRTSTATFSTNDTFLTAEARFAPFALGELPVEPVAALGWFGSRRAGFREQGAGALGLIVDEQAASRWQGRVGLETVFRAFQWGSATVRPHVRLAYATDFGSVPTTATVRWQGAGQTPFAIAGAGARTSGFELDLGLTGVSPGGWTWGLDYEGRFRDGASGHGFLGRMSFGF